MIGTEWIEKKESRNVLKERERESSMMGEENERWCSSSRTVLSEFFSLNRLLTSVVEFCVVRRKVLSLRIHFVLSLTDRTLFFCSISRSSRTVLEP